ncbi:MAG: hypothetical protein KJ886_04935, partial [Candidatus Thermoplasmatota archaeon]|nr:hypothetical protein [Candidatus Thermoplasmatota archaeon]
MSRTQQYYNTCKIFNLMCNITENVFKTVKEVFKDDKRLKEKFNVMIKKDKKYIIGSTNIDVKNDIEGFFNDVCLAVENVVKNVNGEYQSVEIKHGKNVDLGIKQAELLDGRFFEVYCYKCLSAAFVRIWLEKGLYAEINILSMFDFNRLIFTINVFHNIF